MNSLINAFKRFLRVLHCILVENFPHRLTLRVQPFDVHATD